MGLAPSSSARERIVSDANPPESAMARAALSTLSRESRSRLDAVLGLCRLAPSAIRRTPFDVLARSYFVRYRVRTTYEETFHEDGRDMTTPTTKTTGMRAATMRAVSQHRY